MFGYGDDIGVLRRCVTYLLKAKIKFTVQLIEVSENKIFDCAHHEKSEISSHSNASKTDINGFEEIDGLIQNLIRNRSQKSTNQNETSSRSHAIVKLLLNTSGNSLLFVDLAGFENAEGKDDKAETTFINTSLLDLNRVLLSIKKRELLVCTTPLTKFFRSQLDGEIVMLFHAPVDSIESFKFGLSYVKDLAAVLRRPKSTSIQVRSAVGLAANTTNKANNRQNRVPFSVLNPNSGIPKLKALKRLNHKTQPWR